MRRALARSDFSRARSLAPWALAFGFGFVAACTGARKVPAEAPIENIDQMCCKKGDAKSGRFGGCVVNKRACRDETPMWIRGTISCGPVNEAECLGGRCCVFGQTWGTPDSKLQWDAPEGAFPEGAGGEPAPGARGDDMTNEVPDASTPDESPSDEAPSDEAPSTN